MVQLILLSFLLFGLELTSVFVLTFDAPSLLAKLFFEPRSFDGFSGFDKSNHEILKAIFDGSFPAVCLASTILSGLTTIKMAG
jgi:hypothetical protein